MFYQILFMEIKLNFGMYFFMQKCSVDMFYVYVEIFGEYEGVVGEGREERKFKWLS